MRLSTLFISLWTVGHTSGKFPELWRSRMPLSTLFIVYGQWVIHLENFPNYGDLARKCVFDFDLHLSNLAIGECIDGSKLLTRRCVMSAYHTLYLFMFATF